MQSRQKEIFESIHEEYYATTADYYAQSYKEKHLYSRVEHLLGDATTVMELASGKGETSGWLRGRNPSLLITGCDISEPAAKDYTALHGRPCFVADLTKPFEHREKYDAVIVMGGVHHLVEDLNTAFDNIANLLVPGGKLIMAEPNADYFLNPIRRLWYKIDKKNFDAATEEALSHSGLFAAHGQKFRKVAVSYLGGPAYFLLTMNMFLRLPNVSKRVSAPTLMAIERLFEKLPGRLPFAAFVACWERR